MTDSQNSDELPSDPADLENTSIDYGSLFVWTSSSGDAKQSNILHIDSAGMTWLLNIKKQKVLQQLLDKISGQPAETVAIIEAESKGVHLPCEHLVSVNYTEQLNQLTIFDRAGKNYQIENGEDGEQRAIYEAIGENLGGTHRQEDADAWSVMQGPLIGLAATAFFGGVVIFLSTVADPNYEATGRRSGLKQLVNWLGYTLGPTWLSVIVGVIALCIIGSMVLSLVNRPQRDVLEF